jgi:K+/H+ antiporter YhaU regulatory subunit KhtT
MKKNSINKKFNFKNRFRYWFDNKMTNGSLGLIRMLIIASVLLAVLVAFLIIIFNFNEDSEIIAVIWDSISTIINAWMPSFEDGTIGYVILMSIVAIAGVLFTSTLIGIITSAIEEKIDNLKKGNSLVLEKDHIVVLGFYPGEYTLLRQLILASAGKPTCVVIAEDMDRVEMEQDIMENLEVPKNFRIVCRTADITDPTSLEKCSVETSKTIIVSPTDDMRTIKTVLAVSALLDEKESPEISVNAIVSKNEYRFPPSMAEANNITTLQTNSILAKMIAHSCTQTGLSETFKEIFDFEGSEFYLIDLPNLSGLTFSDVMSRVNNATPAGIYHDGEVIINPDSKTIIQENDKVLVFSEEIDSASIEDAVEKKKTNKKIKINDDDEITDTVIIGHNETLPIILSELPENVSKVYLAGQETTKDEQKELEHIASKRKLKLEYYKGNLHRENVLVDIAKMAKHIVILNDHDGDTEESDMEVIFLLLNLRDIRKRYELDFNITVEMQQEHNQKLVGRGDHTDFLVVSSMSSLILAQLAESPELINVFREILSNEGNELYLKNAGTIKLEGEYTIRDLRMIMLEHNYIFLGYIDKEKYSHFNLPLDEVVKLTKEDNLIVLGKK